MGELVHINLQAIARDTLRRYGFLVDVPAAAQAELAALSEPTGTGLRDLTGWLWSSIDNDDSRDLDQIEYLQTEGDGARLYVAIADVDALVAQHTALDQAAQHNTTSLYTGVRTFPLFPDKLSTNLTSLLEGQKRPAVVVEMKIASDGEVTESTLYRAWVQNHAQLAYAAVAAWLASDTSHSGDEVARRVLAKIQASAELQDQLRRQDALAKGLRERRLKAGALAFETLESRPVVSDAGDWELKAIVPNSATQLIEDFMIAANQATVDFLQSKRLPSLRRVVRVPKNWPRIVELAAQKGTALPNAPESKPLEDFLKQQRQKDPVHFPDLSLSVIKLLGRGEYVVVAPDGNAPPHFALAVEGYTHSTAPNRRYPDVITQRLTKAALAGGNPSYTMEELAELAQHCTQKEDDANKAERSIHKSIAAQIMAKRIGEKFEGIITGASEKGVWARLFEPPVEGKVEGPAAGVAVGDRVLVKLVMTDPVRGYIDFNLLSRR